MKETKIVQVYPSDSAIEQAIKEWETFGWELKSNQRYEDKDSSYIPGFGKSTTTTTYNKLTFSREKSSPWYEEIRRLEEEYEAVKGEISYIESIKPENKFGIMDVVMLLLPPFFIPFIIYEVVKSKKYKKAIQIYNTEDAPKLVELKPKAESLKREAETILNAV